MLNKLIFNNRIYSFSDEELRKLYNCMLQNESTNDDDIKYVISFISNSIVRKRFEDLDYHEFLLDGSFRASVLICNISNVFGEDKAKEYAIRLSGDLYADYPAINLDYTEVISVSKATDIWAELFGVGIDFEKFKFLLTLIMLYDLAEFDYGQQCEDYKELRKVTFFNGMGIKQIEQSDKFVLKPLFSMFDAPVENYLEIAGVWIPPTLLSVMFETNLHSNIDGTIKERLTDDLFLFKYEQLSGKRLKIDREDYSKWVLDPRLYGVWYNIYKSTHPVLGTDYSLTIEAYNEDGTMLKHLQLGVKNLNFSNDFRWGKYISKWKTHNNEMLIVNDDLDLKQRVKYEFDNGNLLFGNQVYYRTFDAALEAARNKE